jgi:hypothetical protein
MELVSHNPVLLQNAYNINIYNWERSPSVMFCGVFAARLARNRGIFLLKNPDPEKYDAR